MALNFILKNEYTSYVEDMLIENNEDKVNNIILKSDANILLKNTIFFDFETATYDNMRGHKPYFNHMIKYFNDKHEEDKTLIHYKNSNDVQQDTFNYIMNVVNRQCKAYYKAKIEGDAPKINSLRNPLYLCHYNGANFDMYFFIRSLLNSKYAERYSSKCIFKGGTLVSFMLFDSETGKMAIKSHDICQITNCSLDKACEGYLGQKLKGKFPHFFINRQFFNDKDILNKSFDLSPSDYPKKDRDNLTDADLKNFNVYDNLLKYAKNDVEILVKLYQSMNENIFTRVLHADILRFLTMGNATNYGFMKHLPNECYYKKQDKHHHSRAGNKLMTKLYLCDNKENEINKRKYIRW